MPRHPKGDPATRRSKRCKLPPKQVARRSTSALSAAIHYYEPLKSFKEGIRNRGRYFRFGRETQETWHGKSGKIGKLHQQGPNRVQPNH